MRVEIRPLQEGDVGSLVELSLRAWEPGYESLERTLGSDIFLRQHPDWRDDQRRVVEEICSTKRDLVWVATVDDEVVGFVSVELNHPEVGMGETTIVGVDPNFQGRGIGTLLTKFALARLKEAGMQVAMVETGGEDGHASARKTYEKAGYTLLPIARYFKNL